MASERRRRGFPLFAVLLIALGAVLLLQTTGVLPWEFWGDIWRWWPVLVIALGINIAFGRRMPWLAGTLIAFVLIAAAGIAIATSYETWSGAGTYYVGTIEEPLDGAESVDVSIGLGMGSLVVGSLPAGSNNLVEGEMRGVGRSEARPSVERSGKHVELSFSMEGFDFNFFGDSGRRWEVFLSPRPRASLDVDAAASDMFLDLRDMNVGIVSIVGGASDIEIVAPENAGHVNIDIDVGAASVVIVIPQGVSARIDTDALVSDLSIDEARFPRMGDVYVSGDFDTSANRVDIVIDSGASDVEIR